MRLAELAQRIEARTRPSYYTRISNHLINYYTNERHLDGVMNFYQPYYMLEDGVLPDPTLQVYVLVEGRRPRSGPPVTDMRTYLQSSDPVAEEGPLRLFMRPETGIEVLIDRDRMKVYVRGSDPTEVNLQVRVLVRDQILRPIEQADGVVVFHGAAVEHWGEAVVFMGARDAGKTTSLLALMAYQRYNFLSADRVKFRPASAGVEVFGFPARCNIHRIAMENTPFLQPLRKKLPITYDYEGKVLVEIGHLTQLAGCVITPKAQLSTLVFVQLNSDEDRLKVSECDSLTSSRLVTENIMEGGELDKHVAWMHLFPDRSSTRNQRVGAVVESILQTVRVIQVSASYPVYMHSIREGKLNFLR